MLFLSSFRTRGTFAATVTSTAMIAQQVAGKAVRDALYLSSFHASTLPRVMAAAAVLSLVTIFFLSRLMARFSPRRVMPVLFALSATGLVLGWVVGLGSPPVGAIVVYLQTALFGPALISTFWSLVNEQFDPHSAKAEVARIAGGGTLGGVLGGLAAWRASSLVDLPTVVLALAALNVVCLVGTVAIRAPKDRPSAVPPPQTVTQAQAAEDGASAFRVLRTTPFLRNLALLVAIGAAASSLLDYVFSVQATQAYGKGASLLAFFSLFWLSVSVISFLFQLALGRVAMEKLGLAVNIAVLPGIIIMGGAIGLAVPGLMSSAILRGSEAVQRNTLFRSAYELLYTPLSEIRKRTTKAVIDIGFDRFGTVVGSGLSLVALRLFPQAQLSVLLGIVVALALATLPVVRGLHVGYVAALEEGLREGAEKLDLPSVEGQVVIEDDERAARDKLNKHAEVLGLRLSETPADTSGPASAAFRNPRSLIVTASDLLSGNVERAQRVLSEWSPEKMPLASLVILLLAHKELHDQARTTLRSIAGLVTGQLVDALVNPEIDSVIRRRIPRVLSRCPTQRAVDGLLLGIADARFEVRFECGRALVQITDKNLELVIAREPIVAAVLHEAERAAADALAVAEFDEDSEAEDPNVLLQVLTRDRVDRRLEHVFTILSLLLEREPLRMAFRALHHEDKRHRGTALEYIQTVLPTELREAVWPLLGEEGPLAAARPAQEILADLARASAVLAEVAKSAEVPARQPGVVR